MKTFAKIMKRHKDFGSAFRIFSQICIPIKRPKSLEKQDILIFYQESI